MGDKKCKCIIGVDMSTTIFPKITWIDDDDIIEILTDMEELRLQCESENQKAVAKRNEEKGSCSAYDLKDLMQEEENIIIEQINNFAKQNSRYMANGNQLDSEILNKYGKRKITIEIKGGIDCAIKAKIIYDLNKLDSEPAILNIMSHRENIIRENKILFTLSGMYIEDKDPISLGCFITSRGEKIKVSFLQTLKMVIRGGFE